MSKNSKEKGRASCALKSVRKTKIGGQAVLEGVMMRGASSMALACRDETGNIRLDTTRLPAKKPWYRKVPFIRGVVNLVVSLVSGTKIIGKSAEIMVEDVDTKGNGGGMGWMMFVSTLLGIVLALALFIVAPTAATRGIFWLANISYDAVPSNLVWLKSLLEGVFKLLILVLYMVVVTCMKEIKRVFMYHGAEHKTIACYEAGLELNVENVKKCSRYHDRCGTSFIVFVVVLSVLLMLAFDIIFALCPVSEAFRDLWGTSWFRILFKLALLPVTAGISYEMLMLLASSNFFLFVPLKWLGKQFQKLTTREPDESMCEVAIASFNAVLEMDADPTIPETHFPEPISVEEFRRVLTQEHPDLTACVKGDADWLICAILNITKQDLSNPNVKIPFGWLIRLNKMSERVANGEPWQYAVGATEFYGRTFKVDKNVLIPRQETELVCEQMLKYVRPDSRVLDLCCGSGVLGVTAVCEKGCKATLADLSKQAVEVAKNNAKLNKAKVNIVKSDMFSHIKGKFDVIACNPPYVETAVIDALDVSVKDYEPHSALDGGADGLDFYRILASQARSHLTDGGTLVLEIGYNQGDAVSSLLQDKFDVQVLKDYGGNDRIVVAKPRVDK